MEIEDDELDLIDFGEDEDQDLELSEEDDFELYDEQGEYNGKTEQNNVTVPTTNNIEK